MSFPATRKALEDAGYRRVNYTRCRSCGTPIEFWSTPEHKWIPMETMDRDESPAVSHFANCPNADSHRKAK